MALGTDVALLLRAKGGTNFLTQTHGVNIRDANEASRELMATLDMYSKKTGTRDADGSGNSPPGFAAGQLLVCGDRFLVVYRLVNTVWVITVSPATANVLLCSHIISATIRLLIAASKGIDVTPDKLARSYPEVYLATGHLLTLGGLSANPNTLLSVATSELMSISPETTKSSASKLRPAASLLKHPFSLSKKPLQPSPSPQSFTAPRDVDVSIGRKSEEPDYLASPSFVLPPEAFASQATSPPVGDLGITELPGRNAPASTLDDFFGPPVPVPGSELLAGTGLETLEAPAIDYSNKFANLRPPPPPPLLDNPWGDFDTGVAPAPGPGLQPQPPPKPVLPGPTAKQQRTIANGNALQLVELWKASFVGSRLEMSGTFGEVLATGLVSNCQAEASVHLSHSAEVESRDAIVAAVVQAATGEPVLTERREGTCVALLSQAETGEEVFLRYKLPAIAAEPPILMAVTVSAKPRPRGRRKPSALQLQQSSGADSKPVKPIYDGSQEVPGLQANGSGIAPVTQYDKPTKAVGSTGEEPGFTESADNVEVQFGSSDVDLGRANSSVSVQAVQSAVGAASPNSLHQSEQPGDAAAGDVQESPVPESLAGNTAPKADNAGKGGESTVQTPVDSSPALPTSSPREHLRNGTSGPVDEEAEPNGDSRESDRQATEADSPLAEEQNLRLITVHLAVSPNLNGSLRGVCVDLDIPRIMGDLLGVVPVKASYASKQRRLRWNLYRLDAGSKLRVQVLCKPDSSLAEDISRASSRIVARLHAFGPPGNTLSGIHLASGAISAQPHQSRAAFHCEVIAQPEVLRQGATLSKQERIDNAIRQFQAQQNRISNEKAADSLHDESEYVHNFD